MKSNTLSIAIYTAVLFAIPVLAIAQPGDAPGFLKWSMSKYQALGSFQATIAWQMSPGSTQTRTIQFMKPNRFKMVSNNSAGFMQTSISDGKKQIEYTSMGNMAPLMQPAPASLSSAQSMQLGHPMFNGTMLYKFFGGPGSYTALVDTAKLPVSFGKEANFDGQSCRVVHFFAKNNFGTTDIAISKKDGLVRSIRYSSEPLVALTKKMMADMKQKGNTSFPIPDNFSFETTERYSKIGVGKTIPSGVFSTKTPEGLKAPSELSMPTAARKPALPIGSKAPNFTVSDLKGGKMSLSSLRGKVVLLDFWATWCPPCVKGLPETQRFYDKYKNKGLAVMAISDEPTGTITPFLKQKNLTFPAFSDGSGATNKTYRVEAIPTLVVIDRSGKIVSYTVGLQEPETILAALKRAGLNTK